MGGLINKIFVNMFYEANLLVLVSLENSVLVVQVFDVRYPGREQQVKPHG